MIPQILRSRKVLSASSAWEVALVVRFLCFLPHRLLTVNISLMSVHMRLPNERSIAELARKLLFGSTCGGVVTLVVRVQFFNAVVATVTDLADQVTGLHLKQI